MGVAGLWLSDTSLAVQTDRGGIVSMDFPSTPRTALESRVSAGGKAVKYSNVFPDIDLVIYRNENGFEYDWSVAAGADPASIRVSFRGAHSIRIAPDGDLVLSTRGGEVRHRRPVAYQVIDGRRHSVAAAFDFFDGRVGFRLGQYDKTRALVIDPALAFVSGIGGSGLSVGLLHATPYSDLASGMALDSSGNIYIAGLAYSPDFPLVSPLPITAPPPNPYVACPPAFAAKLSPDGKTILYSTLLTTCSGGAPSIAADPQGNVYVAGTVQGGYLFVQPGGGTVTTQASSAFVAKLSPSGALQAAIAFGGSGVSAVTSVALGPDGKLSLAGTTGSSGFPVTPGALQSTLVDSQDIFLMKLDPALLTGNQLPSSAVLYSTYLGPGSSPFVAADAAGNAYVGASTTSTAWVATPGVYQSQCWDASRVGCADGIVVKVNPAGSQFLYVTYLGGSEYDAIGGLAIDGSGDVYLTGTTDSFDFPATPGAYDQMFFSETGFAIELSPDASHLIYGTFLGDGPSTGTAIAIGSSGNVWVGGWTEDSSLPVQTGIQQTLFNAICAYYTPSGSTPSSVGYCPQAGYIAELNPSGSAVQWATYLGSGNAELDSVVTLPIQPILNSILLDQAGNVLVAGNQLAITSAAASPSKYNTASVVKIATAGTSLSNLSVANAAGFQAGLPAPGGIASLFVDGIPPTGTIVAPGLPLPNQLAGVTVLVDGVAAPIFAVANVTYPANTQVNFQVPFEVWTGEPAPHIVEVQYGGQSAFIVPQQAGPGIFTGPNGGVIQHASDYSLVTLQNPVTRGETLIIYSTGLGYVSTPVPSGEAATAADPIGPNQCNQVTTNAGTVLYAGLTPGFPGLYQVNVQVSQYLPPGVTYIVLQSSDCWLFFPPQNVYQGNAVAIYIPN